MRIPFVPSPWPLLAVVSLSCSSEIGGNGVTGVGVTGSTSSSSTGSNTPATSTAQATSQTNTGAGGTSAPAANTGAASGTPTTDSSAASASTSTGGDGAGLGSAGGTADTTADGDGTAGETSSETSSPPLTEQEQMETETETMPPPGMNADDEMTSETGGGAGGMSGDPGSDAPAEECTDIPDPEQSCQQRFDWGNCEQQWMIDGGFCNRTCGRCTGDGGGDTGGGDTGGGDTGGGDTGGGDTGGGDTGGGSTALGDDNPYPSIAGSPQGNSTRYWDCCKQSCGWTANASQPVDSCDYQGNNIGANDQDKNVCFENGRATTCHGMAPWAHSTKLAFGYAAANGAGCGTCWQLEFTGTSSNGGNDQGSAAIGGKTMIVMATNIGDLNGQLHFDLLIPGGGLGLNNGCTTSLGIPADQLGANRGGFLTSCASAGDHNAKKECVRNSCTSVFGSRGLSDLEAGCLWFVDWFEIADNPNFYVKQVDCPQELRAFN